VLQDLVDRVIEEKTLTDSQLAELKFVKQEIDSVLESNTEANSDSEASSFMDSYKEFFNS